MSILDLSTIENSRRREYLTNFHTMANGYLQSSLKHTVRPFHGVCFEFADDARVNLKSIKFPHENHEEFVCLVFQVGFADMIEDVFARIMREKNIPLSVGDPIPPIDSWSKGKKIEKIFRRWNEAHWYKEDNDRELDPVVPNQLASDLASLLTANALNFVLKHEATHALHGHRPTPELRTSNCFDEYEGCVPEPVALWRQTLEMDADCMAACGGVGFFLSCHESGNNYPDVWKNLQPTITESIYYWCYSIHILFRLMSSWSGSQLTTNMEDALKKTHPPVIVRYEIAMGTAIEYLVKKGHSYSGLVFPQISTSAMLSAEYAWLRITGEDTDFARILCEEQTQEYCGRYIERLNEHWKSVVRPLLEPVSFMRLPD